MIEIFRVSSQQDFGFGMENYFSFQFQTTMLKIKIKNTLVFIQRVNYPSKEKKIKDKLSFWSCINLVSNVIKFMLTVFLGQLLINHF